MIKMRTLLAFGAGAAVSYLADPNEGAARRQQLLERVRPGMGGAGGAAGTQPATPPPGQDTPTGTDPDARYREPGYQDVSFGQAVARDTELAEQIAREEGADSGAATRRFEQEAVGAPAIEHQHEQHSEPPSWPQAETATSDAGR